MAGRALAALAIGAVFLAGAAACGGAADDGSTVVEGPDTADRQAVVAELARASAAQGVCYGWRLEDGTQTVSRGSNLGENVAVDSDPARCKKWVEVRATVLYTSDSSESEDSATIDVQTSPGLTLGSAESTWLARFNLTEQAFIDDPSRAIARAALALPLLAAEAGAASPAPTPSVAATNAQPIGDPGNDFIRDRGFMIVAAALLLLFGALLIVVGFIARRRRRKAPPPHPAPPSHPAPPPYPVAPPPHPAASATHPVAPPPHPVAPPPHPAGPPPHPPFHPGVHPPYQPPAPPYQPGAHPPFQPPPPPHQPPGPPHHPGPPPR